MTEKNMRKKALTAAQILSGGDDSLQELEVPEWAQGEEVGVVYLAEPKAGDVLEFAAKQELKNDDKTSDVDMSEELVRLISKCVVDETGARIFDEEKAMELRNVSISVFNRFAGAVTAMADKATQGGNESSGVDGSASPTD